MKKSEIKKLLTEVVNDTGTMIRNFTNEDHGKYLVTGPQAGGQPIDNYVGKIVQVRKEAGAWGSDIVFLRHHNTLCTHENQFFFLVKEKYFSKLDELFKNTKKDEIGDSYTFAGNPIEETGFIIPSKIKDGETTPLREVRKNIIDALGKL